MLAVEFVADKKARRFFNPKSNAHRIVAKKALELGVMSRALPYVEVNSFSPPLCITQAEIDEGVERYAKALEAVTPELKQLATM
jgi:L-2,4-diaminobutyrate transaminase